ncbi:MAG: DUF6174 domain-containing protein [Bacteroidota bacterium]
MIRLAALVVLAQLAGCAASEPAVDPSPPLFTGGPAAERPDALDEAKAQWEAAGLDDYRLTLSRSCFCPAPDYTGPFDVTVRDGSLAEVRLEGAVVETERGMTVAGLFTLLEEAYARGAATVDVTFDPEAGFPTAVYIDYDVQIADEEIGYGVSDLEAL